MIKPTPTRYPTANFDIRRLRRRVPHLRPGWRYLHSLFSQSRLSAWQPSPTSTQIVHISLLGATMGGLHKSPPQILTHPRSSDSYGRSLVDRTPLSSTQFGRFLLCGSDISHMWLLCVSRQYSYGAMTWVGLVMGIVAGTGSFSHTHHAPTLCSSRADLVCVSHWQLPIITIGLDVRCFVLAAARV